MGRGEGAGAAACVWAEAPDNGVACWQAATDVASIRMGNMIRFIALSFKKANYSTLPPFADGTSGAMSQVIEDGAKPKANRGRRTMRFLDAIRGS